MKHYILRFGAYALILMLAAFTLSYSIGLEKISFGLAEAVGYLAIFLAMGFVFVGIKRYRDETLEGELSFGRAFGMGALIALLPSLGLFLFTVVLFLLKGDEFLATALENMPAEQKARFEANKGLYANPFFQGVVMFFTAYFIGLLMALISGLVLRRSAPEVSGQ